MALDKEKALKIKLSKNFNLWEFVYSYHALENNLLSKQLEIPDEYIENLRDLCVNVLQPLRDYMGCSIQINSGYRCNELNNVVKGSSTSDHLYGKAADIFIYGDDKLKKCFEFIKNNCKFRQLINEKDFSWIHVSYDKNDNKQQILKL